MTSVGCSRCSRDESPSLSFPVTLQLTATATLPPERVVHVLCAVCASKLSKEWKP